MKIRKVLPRLVKYYLPFALVVPNVSLNAGDTFDITIDAPEGSTASATIEMDTENFEEDPMGTKPDFIQSFSITIDDTIFNLSDIDGFAITPAGQVEDIDFDSEVFGQLLDFNIFSYGPSGIYMFRFEYEQRVYEFLTMLKAASDSGAASYSISGTRAAGNVLTAAVSTDDPEGNGTVSSYQWQSSADGSTDWTVISGATSSTYTLTESEEGKYVRVIIVYTDGSSNETTLTVALASPISEMHTEWLQPYAAMQNVGLKSIHNNRDLVLEKAGECNNNGANDK